VYLLYGFIITNDKKGNTHYVTIAIAFTVQTMFLFISYTACKTFKFVFFQKFFIINSRIYN